MSRFRLFAGMTLLDSDHLGSPSEEIMPALPGSTRAYRDGDPCPSGDRRYRANEGNGAYSYKKLSQECFLQCGFSSARPIDTEPQGSLTQCSAQKGICANKVRQHTNSGCYEPVVAEADPSTEGPA